MILRIEHFTTLLIFFVVTLIAGCRQETVVLPQEPTPDVVTQDDHDHSTAYTKVPKAPEGDDFFKTIQFPKTPPKLDRGHYRLPKNPFPIPDYVKKYPDHFKIDKRGFWAIAFPPEKARKLEAFSGWDLSEEEYDRQITEIVGEGLDTLTTAKLLSHMGGFTKRANELFDKAYMENPDGLHTGLPYYTRLQNTRKLHEAEAGFRKLVKMHPDSTNALYKLAVFLVEDRPVTREVIPYLERLYHQKPFWYAPIYYLGITYYRLREYDKALAYLQASEVFTGPMDISSTLISVIQSTTRNTKREENK